MFRVTEDQRAHIAELCRRFGVRRLDLFGSVARADFQESRSDLDFLVEFVDEAPRVGLDTYFGLKSGLEGLLGRSIDLVMPDAVTNPYVRADLARDRITVYRVIHAPFSGMFAKLPTTSPSSFRGRARSSTRKMRYSVRPSSANSR